jgi:hypothetical protein
LRIITEPALSDARQFVRKARAHGKSMAMFTETAIALFPQDEHTGMAESKITPNLTVFFMRKPNCVSNAGPAK